MWRLIALADRKTVFDAAGLLLSIFKAGGVPAVRRRSHDAR